jgi:hypothetical protein
MRPAREQFEFFRTEGYSANIDEVRKIHPGLHTLQSWIAEESAYRKK